MGGCAAFVTVDVVAVETVDKLARHLGGVWLWHYAARAGVKCGLVEILIVDAFNDVNFARVRPVRAEGPKCWPNRIALGDVVDVNNK